MVQLKTYKELEQISKGFGLDFYLEYKSKEEEGLDGFFKLSNHIHPLSIKEEESQIIFDTIVLNNFKSGFEVATAFGISASSIGQGLKITGGKLVTLDAYIEESVNSAGGYDVSTRKVNQDADGYRMATCLFKALDLEEIITPIIGWSPDDVPSAIKILNCPEGIDFAFIDGGHSSDQILEDVKAVYPYLKNDCIFMFHDWKSHREVLLENHFNLQNLGFDEVKRYKTGYNLCMYKRGNTQLI